MARTTLTEVAVTLNHIKETTDKLDTFCRAEFSDLHEAIDGCDEYPGIRGRLDRLEQKEKSRTKHLFTLYTAAITCIAGAILYLLGIG